MVKKRFAAGGVVIKKERGYPRVLLIKDSYGRWTWPKGHLEKGETPEEGALREVAEETGQDRVTVVEELGQQQYYYTLKGRRIFKTVHIFLIKASARRKLIIQTEEIEKGAWFRADDAVKKIEYQGSVDLLKKGIRLFKNKFC